MPDVTVYHGSDRKWSEWIYRIASKHPFCLSYRVDSLETLIAGQEGGDAAPVLFDEEMISRIAGEDARKIKSLPALHRLGAIDRVCRYLVALSDSTESPRI